MLFLKHELWTGTNQIDGDETAGGARVDGHVVGRVVEELGSCVPLNVVGVVVTPTELETWKYKGLRLYKVFLSISQFFFLFFYAIRCRKFFGILHTVSLCCKLFTTLSLYLEFVTLT